mgnify:FL=1
MEGVEHNSRAFVVDSYSRFGWNPTYEGSRVTQVLPSNGDMARDITVLYVNDNEAGLAARADLLGGYDRLSVSTASEAEAALGRITDGGFDCLLPERAGLEFVRDVRATDATLPIVLLSSNLADGVLIEALSAGVTDCVPKSVVSASYDVLADRLRRCADTVPDARGPVVGGSRRSV